MDSRRPHEWNVTPQEAIRLQQELRALVNRLRKAGVEPASTGTQIG